MDTHTRTICSALRMAEAFVEEELERRRESGLRRYMNEAANVLQHLRDALRACEEDDE